MDKVILLEKYRKIIIDQKYCKNILHKIELCCVNTFIFM